MKKQKGKALTFTARKRIFERDGWKCSYCGKELDAQGFLTRPVRLVDFTTFPCVDHVIPKVHGGTDSPDNLVTSCWSCNGRKKDRTVTHLIQLSDRAGVAVHV